MEADRFELFTAAVAQITKSINQIKNAEMAPFHLRGNHVMCLFYLRQGGGLTAARLSEAIELDKGAVSRLLSELEQQGCIAFSDAGQKRRYRTAITLTEKGMEITDSIAEQIAEAVNRAGEGFTEAERQTFYKVLLIISENLKNYAAHKDNPEQM